MPVSKRVLIFANPIAGRGAGAKLARRIRFRLSREGMAAEVLLGRPDGISAGALGAPPHAAIAIGGDGTIRAVAERLYHAFGPQAPPLFPVPMGTANLLARHLGIRPPEDVEGYVAAAVAARKIVWLDAALANDELFLLMAGVGIDASVVHELGRMRTGPIDYTSYVLPAALALSSYRYPPLTVTVDGRAIARDLPAVAFVGNVKEYGTGFPVLPDARSDDGVLDVCVLPASDPRDLLVHLLRAMAGEHLRAEGSIFARGQEIRVDAQVPVPVQIDGDPAGHTPLKIQLLPLRLPFILPA